MTGYDIGTGDINLFDWYNSADTSYRVRHYQEHYYVALKYDLSDIDKLRLENALKATERMILMGRAFVSKMVTIFIRKTTVTLKQMFSKSGHLSKRIRRKRCQR